MNFLDANEYQGSHNKEGITFKEIALNQVSRITKLASKEYRGGYFEKKTHVISGAAYQDSYYVPDSREELSNAILGLYWLCEPHMNTKKKPLENVKEIYDDILSEPLPNDEITRNKKLMNCVILFREISKFLKSNNYFASKIYEEDVDFEGEGESEE